MILKIILVVLLLTGCVVEKDHLENETTYETKVIVWNGDLGWTDVRITWLIDSTVIPPTYEALIDSVEVTSYDCYYKFDLYTWVKFKECECWNKIRAKE